MSLLVRGYWLPHLQRMSQTAEKKKHVTDSPITVKQLLLGHRSENTYTVGVVYVSSLASNFESPSSPSEKKHACGSATPISNNKPLLVAG
jgi:hypothetical protein